MALDSKDLQALILCILTPILFISCSDSSTNTSTNPEETEPPTPLTGLDNYPEEHSEVSVIVELRDAPTRMDVYLPEDTEFQFSINEEIIAFERDTIYDSGPTNGVHYLNFEKSFDPGETLELELLYKDQTYSHTLSMPYSPNAQIPDSLDNRENLDVTWSVQKDPALFLFSYSYAFFDEEFNVVDSGGDNLQLDGDERSFVIEKNIVSEMSVADTWNISLTSANFCYWDEGEVLFRMMD